MLTQHPSNAQLMLTWHYFSPGIPQCYQATELGLCTILSSQILAYNNAFSPNYFSWIEVIKADFLLKEKLQSDVVECIELLQYYCKTFVV